MSLIKLKDGDTINSAHVVKFTHLRNGRVKFLLSTGDAQCGETDVDMDEAVCPIIPAAPGFVAVFSHRWPDGHFQYKRRTVIAWRLCPAGSYPLFEGSSHTDEPHDIMIDPDGGIFDCDGNVYSAFEEWRAEYEADAKERISATSKAAA